MSDIKWVDNHIEIAPPKKTKKLTGTRFASIFGLNPWSSEFEIWCAVTKTWEKPFEETIYTAAGKVIEGLQIEYMRSSYGMYNLRTPTDVYGEDYFHKTWGDFFRHTPILGGLWDSLLVDTNGKPEAVIEFKTTKRAEDWAQDVPEYYALQAALYAYLLGVDDVIMVGSFLEPKDYEAPENFVPSVKNTITKEFKVSERYPNFPDMVAQAQAWWNAHVVTGISPDYDEKKDAEILKALRTNHLPADTNIKELIEEAEQLKAELEPVYASVADKEKRLKAVTEQIKKQLKEAFTPTANAVEHKGGKYLWSMTKSTSFAVDEDAMKADGVYQKYLKPKDTFRMTTKSI